MKSDLEVDGGEFTVVMEKGLAEGSGVSSDPASRILAMNTLAAVCHSRFPDELLLIGSSLRYSEFGGQRGRKEENNLFFGFLLKLRFSGGFN